jgi:hypothetical protein
MGRLGEDGDGVPEAVAVEPAGDIEPSPPVLTAGQLGHAFDQALHELGHSVAAGGGLVFATGYLQSLIGEWSLASGERQRSLGAAALGAALPHR